MCWWKPAPPMACMPRRSKRASRQPASCPRRAAPSGKTSWYGRLPIIEKLALRDEALQERHARRQLAAVIAEDREIVAILDLCQRRQHLHPVDVAVAERHGRH